MERALHQVELFFLVAISCLVRIHNCKLELKPRILFAVLTSHLTPHTSHFTPHNSHLTPHTCYLTPIVYLEWALRNTDCLLRVGVT